MENNKERLDVLLVEKGFFDTREKAKRNIMAGVVFVDNERIDKCGQKVKTTSNIEVKGNSIPYVSRGGLKLEKAVNEFKLDLNGKVCMDVGASTGGFTDCMLQHGAAKVYAVDVGYGQFDWKLRNDPRVTCMERTNIRYVKPEDIGESIDFASIDVSFISLRLVLPVVKSLLKQDGEITALIKPQFEAGRDKVGKKGVVRDKETHFEVIKNVAYYAASIGLLPYKLTYSPVKGPEGNIEYLLYMINNMNFNNMSFNELNIENIIKKVVEESHKSL